MRIVDRKTFLEMPANTVFSKYEPCAFDDLQIKGESLSGIDFYASPIHDAVDFPNSSELFNILFDAQTGGSSFEMGFNTECRDGLYDEHQLFRSLGSSRCKEVN